MMCCAAGGRLPPCRERTPTQIAAKKEAYTAFAEGGDAWLLNQLGGDTHCPILPAEDDGQPEQADN
ncbi:MAG: hypothetical protein R3E31_19390 [Chloroflexota bacterium]